MINSLRVSEPTRKRKYEYVDVSFIVPSGYFIHHEWSAQGFRPSLRMEYGDANGTRLIVKFRREIPAYDEPQQRVEDEITL